MNCGSLMQLLRIRAVLEPSSHYTLVHACMHVIPTLQGTIIIPIQVPCIMYNQTTMPSHHHQREGGGEGILQCLVQ